MDATTWDAIAGLLEEAWPGKFDDDQARSWRVLLDGRTAEEVVEGVRRLLHEGREFRPSVSQLLAAIRRDPSRPTFAEALRLIYGPGGVMRARVRPAEGSAVVTYRSEAHRRQLAAEARLARAQEMHPLVTAFVHRQGIERLQQAGLDDPDYGSARRAQLEREWNEHVETFDGRDVAALAAPRDTAGELKRLDPLSALPAQRRPQLEAGQR